MHVLTAYENFQQDLPAYFSFKIMCLGHHSFEVKKILEMSFFFLLIGTRGVRKKCCQFLIVKCNNVSLTESSKDLFI